MLLLDDAAGRTKILIYFRPHPGSLFANGSVGAGPLLPFNGLAIPQGAPNKLDHHNQKNSCSSK